MARRKTTSTLQRVRRMLLFGLLIFVATLVGLYLLGRRPSSRPAPIDREQAPDGTLVRIIGRNFRHEVSEEGKKLFDIEADRLLSDEKDLFILEGVEITMQREEDGEEYTMTADSGSYRLQRNEASLTGDVVLIGSSGLRLETDGLELRRRGDVVVSSAPVKIEMGAYRGRADRLEVIFPRNRILLAGDVEMTTAPGANPAARLDARRTIFFRDTHNFLAEGRVRLQREEDVLRARRLSLNLDEADRKVLFARASWRVSATLHQVDDDGVPSVATVTGDELSVVFHPQTGDPERLEIGAPDGGRALLKLSDATGLLRGMGADYLWADFSNGRLREAEGAGGVRFDEVLEFAPKVLLKQVCADTASASYDARGNPELLRLDGAVSYLEPEFQAGGDQLSATGSDGPVELVGDLAWVASTDGRLEAPRIAMDRRERTAEAVDGVRAELDRGGADLAAGAEAELPVRVQAGRADWTQEPRSFRFQENVRAWQGENFLVSQTLGMEDDVMVADGGVRTVWHRRIRDEVAAGGEREPPVTIAAAKMRYLRRQGRLVYDGSAQIVQGGRSMSCPLLQLEVNELDEFERMYCEGGTQIRDDDGGSQITGDAAIYNTDAGKVKVVGDPVRMVQTGGGTITARLLVYDFDTAIAEIDSFKDADADLFMSASEYFRQFSPAPPAAPAVEVPPEVEAAGDAPTGTEAMADQASAEPDTPVEGPPAEPAEVDPGSTTPPDDSAAADAPNNEVVAADDEPPPRGRR